MSSKLHGLVWEGCAHAGLILSRVAVMARLADYSNDDGLSWPAVESIQRQIGAKSKTTVSAAIDELEKGGWLTKTERKEGGRNLSNLYQLNVEKLEAAAESARASYRKNKRSTSRVTPPTVEGSTVNPPTVNPSNINPPKIDPSTVEGSTIEKKAPVKGSMVDPDPSLTTDPSDKRSSCPVSAKPDPEVLITDQAKRILSHLNQTTGSRFQVCKTSLEHIRARLREGFTPDEMTLVIDYSMEKWGADIKMSEYIRPTTLFIPSNLPGYLQSATRWDSAGRPERKDWGRARKHDPMKFGPVDTNIPEGFRG